MDFKQIIKDNLPEGVEITDSQLSAAAKAVQSEVGKSFVPKEDYRKKIEKIDDLETRLKDSGSASADAEAYRTKAKELKEEIKSLKDSYATEKQTEKVKSAVRKHLEADGANPKIIDLLESKVDFTAVELDGESGAVKGWEAIGAPLKEQYSDFYGEVKTMGADPANPASYTQQKQKTGFTIQDSMKIANMLNEDRLTK